MADKEPSRENPNGPIGSKIIFENELVRVWNMTVPAGGKKAWHKHTLPYVIIPITGGKIELETVEGKFIWPEEKAGEAIWRDAGEAHELRNLTGKTYQNVLVELKKP